MQLIVFEDAGYANLLPLAYARPTFDLRCGLDDLLSKIEEVVGPRAEAVFVRESLAAVTAERQSRRVNQPLTADDQLWINGRLLLRAKPDLPENSAVWQGDALAAARLPRAVACKLNAAMMLEPAKLRETLASAQQAELPEETGRLIDYPWQLVHENEAEIERQFGGIRIESDGRIDPGAILLNESRIHIGEGSRIRPTAVLDAEAGPIVIGENVTVGPHAVIAGPCFIGDHCTIKPGGHISGSAIGPFCKVGGEIEASIFQGYSNKQHDGFLGHSYIGEWVNLGADTVTSDLKNTYGRVRVPINGQLIDSGEMFVGAFIGDHSKTGINVALPTGCAIGFAANIFLSRYPPRFVPSFSWLTDEGEQRNDPQRALEVAKMVVARRDREFSSAEQALFLEIAEAARRIEKG